MSTFFSVLSGAVLECAYVPACVCGCSEWMGGCCPWFAVQVQARAGCWWVQCAAFPYIWVGCGLVLAQALLTVCNDAAPASTCIAAPSVAYTSPSLPSHPPPSLLPASLRHLWLFTLPSLPPSERCPWCIPVTSSMWPCHSLLLLLAQTAVSTSQNIMPVSFAAAAASSPA